MKRSLLKIKKVKSQFIIITAFTISLIIILLVYNSNRLTSKAKVSKIAIEKQAQQNASDRSAQDIMEAVQKLINDLKSNPYDYNLNVQAGNAFFDIGRYKQAIQYYKIANTIKPITEIFIDLGVCYFNLGYLDSALIVMQEGIRNHPTHKQGLYNIGIVLYNLGDFNGAVVNWRRLIQAHPNTTEAIRVQHYINEIKNAQTGT